MHTFGKQNLHLSPTQDEVANLFADAQGNCVPVYASISADILTPVSAYLRITNGAALESKGSFLLESIVAGSHQARYSYVGAGPPITLSIMPVILLRYSVSTDPVQVIRTGEGQEHQGDPLNVLQKVLDEYNSVPVPGAPPFTGRYLVSFFRRTSTKST